MNSLLERAERAASAARRRSVEGWSRDEVEIDVDDVELPPTPAPVAPVGEHSRGGRRLPSAALAVFALLVLKLLVFRLFVWGVPGPLMVLADVAAVAVLVGLVGLLAPTRRTSLVTLWAVNVAVSVLLVAALTYEKYYGTLPIYRAFDELDQAAGVESSITEVFRVAYLVPALDLLLAPLVWLGLRMLGLSRRPRARFLRRVKNFGSMAALGLITSMVLVYGNADVRNETTLSESLGVLTYEAHALAKDLVPDSLSLRPGDTYDQVAELKQSRTGPVPAPGKAAHFGAGKGKNLVVVQLEAMQSVLIGLEVDGQEVTPFLNQLVKYSFFFPRHFQQIGKGGTSDAEFMSNTSIYPVGNVAMSAAYSDRAIPSLPKLLKQRGYVSETFHVNTLEFWDRDKLYPAIGFDKWHAQEEFENDHFNQIGASDVELYETGLRRIAELEKGGKPWYAQFITASGHGPFNMPQDKERLELPARLRGTQVGKYLLAQNYADYALGTFVAGLKEQEVWDDTVFVAYGDHFGLWEEDTVAAIRELGADYRWQDRITTPLVMRVHGEAPERVEKVGAQLDIMPTIANLMGISLDEERFVHFGSDLLNTKTHAFGERFYMPTGSFINDDLWFTPGRGFADGTALSQGDWKETDPTAHRKDYEYVLELMRLSDAYVESLPPRRKAS